MSVYFLSRISRFFEFFRYGIGCACNLILKVLLSSLFTACGLSIWSGYLFTLIFLLFSSFFYHYFITFQRKFDGFKNLINAMIRFTATMLSFHALDYIIVTSGITCLEHFVFKNLTAYWQQELFHASIIFCSSVILFLLRYFCFRFLFHKKKDKISGKESL